MFQTTNGKLFHSNVNKHKQRHTLAAVPEHIHSITEPKIQASPLHLLAINGNKQLLQKHINSREWNIDEVDHMGRTPLIYSILGDQVDCVLLLLKEGASIDDTDVDERTALHWAAYQGNHKLVKLLLSNGANRVKRDKEGKTPLHFSTSHDNIKVMQFLIKSMKDVEIDTADNKKMTALSWSVFYDRYEYVKLLLRNGASPTCFDHERRIVLHWTNENKNALILNMLLDEDFTALNWQDSEGRSTLHLCVGQSNFCLVESILKRKDIEVNIQDKIQRTPLHWAAVLGNTKLVSLLLDNGADYKIGDKNGVRPLQYSAQNNFHETMQVMIDKNVKDIPDNDRGTALMWASVKGCHKVLEILLDNKSSPVNAMDIHQQTALHMSTQAGHLHCVKLLIKHGADVNLNDGKHHIPLFYACASGNTEIVNELLLHSSPKSIEKIDLEGRCPLHYAAMVDRTDVIKILMQSQPNPNIKDNAGCPPLHFAAYGGFVHCMSVLLENGADVNSRNNEGRTALHWACKSGSLDAVKILVTRFNANVNILEFSGSQLTPIDYAFLEDHQDVAFYLTENNAYTGAFLMEFSATKIQATWRSFRQRKVLKSRHILRKKFIEEDLVSPLHGSVSSTGSHKTNKQTRVNLSELNSISFEEPVDSSILNNYPINLQNSATSSIFNKIYEQRDRSASMLSVQSNSAVSSVFSTAVEKQLKPRGPKFLLSGDNPLKLRRGTSGSVVSLGENIDSPRSPVKIVFNGSHKNSDNYWTYKNTAIKDEIIKPEQVSVQNNHVPNQMAGLDLPHETVLTKSYNSSSTLDNSFNLNNSTKFHDRNNDNDVLPKQEVSIDAQKKVINNNLYNRSYSRHVSEHKISPSPSSIVSTDTKTYKVPFTQNVSSRSSSVDQTISSRISSADQNMSSRNSSTLSKNTIITSYPSSSSGVITSTQSSFVYLNQSNDQDNPWSRYKRDQKRIYIIRKKMDAAIKIQRFFRAYLSKVKRERLTHQSPFIPPIVIESDADDDADEDEFLKEVAALVIQLAWREFLKGKLLAKVSYHELEKEDQDRKWGNTDEHIETHVNDVMFIDNENTTDAMIEPLEISTESVVVAVESAKISKSNYKVQHAEPRKLNSPEVIRKSNHIASRQNNIAKLNNADISTKLNSQGEISDKNTTVTKESSKYNHLVKSLVKKHENNETVKKRSNQVKKRLLASISHPHSSPYLQSFNKLTPEHIDAIRKGKPKILLSAKTIQ